VIEELRVAQADARGAAFLERHSSLVIEDLFGCASMRVSCCSRAHPASGFAGLQSRLRFASI
jgi:hypothetical protein